MKLMYMFILFIFLSANAAAQDVMTEEVKTEQELLSERVANLASITSDLFNEVDSLKKLVADLRNEIERSKWNLIEQGMTTEKVISILGVSTKVEDASFGYKKLIFGEGYSGYVLFDKEMKSADWSPPLNLRIKLNR